MEKFFELKEKLLEKGASFVGFSDISDLNYGQYKGAITIGIKLLDSYFEEVKNINAPTYEYFHHYRTVNFALDQLALYASLYLEKLGYKVKMVPASQSSVQDPYSGAFPHKTAAVKSNNGFIGKNALFIHYEYGSKVRLCTVLIDKPLTPDRDSKDISCGTCNKCYTSCPANAIKGSEYVSGADRDTIFDAKKCSDHMKKAYRDIGRGSVCGICIAVCPFNKLGSN